VKLAVAELKSELYQDLSCTRDVDIHAVRLHLYKHNEPQGNLKVQITNGDGLFLAESGFIPMSSISDQPFFHGYIRFLVSYPMKKNSLFRVYLKYSGKYSFSDSAYIGWCNDFDLRKYPATYSPNKSTRAALDLEVWSKSERVR
jgi:hypothetical protein